MTVEIHYTSPRKHSTVKLKWVSFLWPTVLFFSQAGCHVEWQAWSSICASSRAAFRCCCCKCLRCSSMHPAARWNSLAPASARTGPRWCKPASPEDHIARFLWTFSELKVWVFLWTSCESSGISEYPIKLFLGLDVGYPLLDIGVVVVVVCEFWGAQGAHGQINGDCWQEVPWYLMVFACIYTNFRRGSLRVGDLKYIVHTADGCEILHQLR